VKKYRDILNGFGGFMPKAGEPIRESSLYDIFTLKIP
jgi:hypothetical protein